MDIYCITHKNLDFIEKLKLIPCGVGINKYPLNYIDERKGENISEKNSSYGELTFHYWFWKNKINEYANNSWFGFCHYRRFFIKNEFEKKIQNVNNKQGFIGKKLDIDDLKSMLINNPREEWKDKDVILCQPIDLQKPKKMKIIKRGFSSLIRDPSILFDKKKCTIKLQFEMSHGYKNLINAVNLLPENEKKDFKIYIETKTNLSPNCMFFSKNAKLVKNFYKSAFLWLEKCEKVFGLKSTNEYGTQRMYNFLFERYLPYWFEKYSKVGFSPWIYYDLTKNKIE